MVKLLLAKQFAGDTGHDIYLINLVTFMTVYESGSGKKRLKMVDSRWMLMVIPIVFKDPIEGTIFNKIYIVNENSFAVISTSSFRKHRST